MQLCRQCASHGVDIRLSCLVGEAIRLGRGEAGSECPRAGDREKELAAGNRACFARGVGGKVRVSLLPAFREVLRTRESCMQVPGLLPAL